VRCSRVQEMLSRYLAGEYNSFERAALAKHLSSCDTCSDIMADLRRLNEMLDLWRSEPAPDDLLDAVMIEVSKLSPGVSVQHCLQPVPTSPAQTPGLLRHLAVAAALALALSWGIGSWLVAPQALAATGADRLVHSYATASDSVMQDTANVIESLTGKLNFEELMNR